MKRYYQFQPVVIEDFETSEWRHPVHRHNHYELIYIKNGAGIHFINNVGNPYRKQDVFLLGPDDDHYFEITDFTNFVYIKFTDLYLYMDAAVTALGLQKLEYLIKSREIHFSGFRLTTEDQRTLAQLFNVIVSLKDNSIVNGELIWFQVLSIAAILQRNMPELNSVGAGTRNKDIEALFSYLHKHIYTPEKIRAEIIAERFNTTTDYIGPYFKRNTGLTLREYIRSYRKALITQRIESGRYSMKQIAAEFGLTDGSHVRKAIS